VAEISPSIVVFVPKDSETNTIILLPYYAKKQMVRRGEPFSSMSIKPSHLTACQTLAKSMSIPVFSRRSGSKALV